MTFLRRIFGLGTSWYLLFLQNVHQFGFNNFQFTSAVDKCGFQLKLKDLSNKYFYMFDFVKMAECKKKIPEFNLKPCFYKKR